jgi:uncharacterized protein
MLLSLQADVYGLYHMTDPEVFYNRGDQWSVATENGSSQAGDQPRAGHATQFRADDAARRIGRPRVRRDPALHAISRNNMIGWIAARSDGAHYGPPWCSTSQDAPRRRAAAD